MIRNPRFKPQAALGVDDTAYDALKAAVVAFFDTNANQRELTDDAVRAVDPALQDERLFNQVLADLGARRTPA